MEVMKFIDINILMFGAWLNGCLHRGFLFIYLFIGSSPAPPLSYLRHRTHTPELFSVLVFYLQVLEIKSWQLYIFIHPRAPNAIHFHFKCACFFLICQSCQKIVSIVHKIYFRKQFVFVKIFLTFMEA